MFGTKEIKEVREITGAGMLDCKNALEETKGDVQAAVNLLRERGLVKVAKKSGRIAAEGLLALEVSDDGKKATLVEVNSETDFVAKNDDFRVFVENVAKTVQANAPADMDALKAATLVGGEKNVEDTLNDLIARIGENMNLRRFAFEEIEDGYLYGYLHGNHQVASVVGLKSDASMEELADLGKDLAMQVTSMSPRYISREDVDEKYIASEKEVLLHQAQNENAELEAQGKKGRPANIIEKMVEGRLQKQLQEACLLEQTFIKDSDLTVGQLVEKKAKDLAKEIKVVTMIRYEVGEGLEKKSEDFAAEVAKQMQ
ncbi:MAG TPA: elongation factor Ts [Tissierellia bacterium]|jgi:elongation factor Ts|nr:elongation factor Ts [Tissierellia bacterium]